MNQNIPILLVAFILFALNTATAEARPSEHLERTLGTWQVIVQDRIAGDAATTPAGWSTILSDGNKTTRLPGIVVVNFERLYRLTVINTRETESCPNGGYPFTYSVDELAAQPLNGRTHRVWLGQGALALARSAMRLHLASCKEFASFKGSNSAADSYERTRIRFEALYGRYVGIEELTESRAHGQKEELVLFDRGLHNLISHGIATVDKRLLTKQELEQARQKYMQIPGHARQDLKTSHLTNYVLLPSGGGAAAEFAITDSDHPPLTVRNVRVEIKRDLYPWYDHLRHAFVASHPQLIPWDKASFYAISPDRSAVVYELNHHLYWQGLTSAPKLLADTHEVRGWQWHESRLTVPTVQKTHSEQ